MSKNYYPNIPQPKGHQVSKVVYVQNSNIVVRTSLKIASGIFLYLVISYIIRYLYNRFVTQNLDSLDIWSEKYGKSYISKFDIRNVYLYMNE